jgi:hypothetical protein
LSLIYFFFIPSYIYADTQPLEILFASILTVFYTLPLILVSLIILFIGNRLSKKNLNIGIKIFSWIIIIGYSLTVPITLYYAIIFAISAFTNLWENLFVVFNILSGYLSIKIIINYWKIIFAKKTELQ